MFVSFNKLQTKPKSNTNKKQTQSYNRIISNKSAVSNEPHLYYFDRVTPFIVTHHTLAAGFRNFPHIFMHTNVLCFEAVRCHHTHFGKDNINIPINSNKFAETEDVMQRWGRNLSNT